MPTQEERLSALEQTIRDISHNETILLGMAVKQGENIQGMMASLTTLDEHFSTLEGHVGTLEDRLGTFEQSVDNRFGTLEGRLDTFEQSVNSRFEEQGKLLEDHGNKLDQILILLNTLTPKPDQGT